MVKLFRFDYTTQECLALQILPRAKTHADDVRFPAAGISTSAVEKYASFLDAPKFVHNLLRNPFTILLASNRVGQHDLVDELAHGPLETSMALIVVWAGEARSEPRRLGIWNLGVGVRREWLYLWFLALDGANLQARVLPTVKHFLPVQAKKRVGGVFPRYYLSLL